MRGKEGTTVKIGILREGNAEPLQFTLKRSRVELHSVKAELLEPGMGYVRISQFSETTGDDLEAALKDLRKRNAAPLKGLVLDLRNNPGGVLEAAVAVVRCVSRFRGHRDAPRAARRSRNSKWTRRRGMP